MQHLLCDGTSVETSFCPMAGGTSSFNSDFGGTPGHRSLKPINQDFFGENWAEPDLYLCTDSTELLSKWQ